MRPQSQILQTLRAPEAQARLAHIVAQGACESRAALGREVCAQFGFVDARGTAQLTGCLKALTVLEAERQIPLPAPRLHPQRPSPRCLDAPVPAPVGVPTQVRDVEGLRLVVVEDEAQRRLWNTLLATEHPQGTTTFVGGQLRYLVGSAHGWLGALGFSASALRLHARDTWIGWSDAQRSTHLHRVVCLSRFLIRPAVRCRHVASHVLGRALRRVETDFEARYHYRPWLVETFVEPEHGAVCFQAANFVCVGHTAGRGRCDRAHAGARTVKSVYLYELAPHWRRSLGVARVEAAPSRHPGEGLDSAQWAANELGGAPLGDKRLSARLVRSATLLASCPGHAFTGAPDRAAMKGYYRFIDHPDESQVTPAHIVAPHRARTLERMRAHDTVLCIQDGTDLNFATRAGCEGLSIIGRNQTSAKTRGLHLHLTLAVSGAGLPLGVLRCGFDEPSPDEASPEQDAGENDEAHAGRTDIVEETDDAARKTRRWLDGLHDVAEAASALPRKVRVISVMDREADFFELFDAQRRIGRVDVLVRAKHDRRLGQGVEKRFATLRNAPADGQVEIDIARVSARPKASRKQARPARSARVARAEVRYRALTLPSTVEGLAPVTLWAVHVHETAPPDGEKPLEWFLLTSVRVECLDAALETVGHYLRRWRVEDFFRVLKSGCRAEHLGFHSAERLQRALTLQAVIAWRLMLMTLLGREVPECDAKLLFTDIELRFLADYAADSGLSAPDTLAGAVLLVAILGGYQNRKYDPPPGHQIMWRGYERMSIATLGYRIAEKHHGVKDIVQNE